MKKILGILSVTGLVAGAATSVISCETKTDNEIKYTYLYDVNIVNNWIFANFFSPIMTVKESSKLSDINDFDFFWNYWSDTFDDLKEKIGEDQFLTFKEYVKINLYMFFSPFELTWKYDEFKDKTFKDFKNENTVDNIFLGVNPHDDTSWFNKNLRGSIDHFEIRIKFN